MIDGSEKRNRQLAFGLQNSHVCEKRSKILGVHFTYDIRAKQKLNIIELISSIQHKVRI